MAVFFVVGCGSNNTTKAQEDEDVSFSLNYLNAMEFTRGVENTYLVEGEFAQDEKPKITIDGLPEGAIFEENLITWTPSCDLSREDGKFIKGYEFIELRINFESLKTDNIIQRPAFIIVHYKGEGSTCED